MKSLELLVAPHSPARIDIVPLTKRVCYMWFSQHASELSELTIKPVHTYLIRPNDAR